MVTCAQVEPNTSLSGKPHLPLLISRLYKLLMSQAFLFFFLLGCGCTSGVFPVHSTSCNLQGLG